MPRPNILYIHSHDTGRYIQPYGHAVPTPHLQEFAEMGILFRQVFCGSPSCSASRAALLTGQCSHSSGMLGLAHRGWKLHDYSQHLLRTLQKHGYYAALCGVQHIAVGPEAIATIGYDHHIESPTRRTTDVAPRVIKWLENAPQEPFFLDVGFIETHTLPNHSDALFDSEVGDSRYVLPPAPLPDTPEVRQDMADFKMSARRLDDAIGQILASLEANGLAQNTLVICTTDHGIPLPRMKCNLTDHGTGVMLMMRGPKDFCDGIFTGGEVVDALLSQIDIYPTVCEALGIEKPSWLQGQSFLPVLRGEQAEVNEAVFTEVTHHATYEPMRAIRTKRWKYIRRFDDRAVPTLPNCDNGRSKNMLVENGWRELPVPQEQLVDLLFDPNEGGNLASDPRYASILAEMRERLDAWMHATDDPLLRGPIPFPSDSFFKDPNDFYPDIEKVGPEKRASDLF